MGRISVRKKGITPVNKTPLPDIDLVFKPRYVKDVAFMKVDFPVLVRIRKRRHLEFFQELERAVLASICVDEIPRKIPGPIHRTGIVPGLIVEIYLLDYFSSLIGKIRDKASVAATALRDI